MYFMGKNNKAYKNNGWKWGFNILKISSILTCICYGVQIMDLRNIVDVVKILKQIFPVRLEIFSTIDSDRLSGRIFENGTLLMVSIVL